MARTTESELRELARYIADATGRDIGIGYAYGHPRLEERGGYRELSPRLPAGQLAAVLRGMLQGIRLAAPHDARAEWRNGALSGRCQECGQVIHHRGPALPNTMCRDGYGCKHWRHNPRRADADR